MRRIAVIGASVSAQATNHAAGEVTGYCEYLRRNHMKDLKAQCVTQLCYPGNRLTDGGYVQATAVAELAPDFVILEPNIEGRDRGRWPQPEDIAFVVSTICSTGARPILLMLPTEAQPKPSDQHGYYMFRSFANTHHIPMIDFSYPRDRNISEYLRGVHTSPLGGTVLAKVLAQTLPGIFRDYEAGLIRPTVASIPSPRVWSRVAFDTTKAVRQIQLKVAGIPGSKLTIIQPQIIGPHSPVIEICADETVSRMGVWDPYCHYDRKSFVRLYDGPLPRDGLVEITCSGHDPDYAKCRRDVDNWPAAAQRNLRPVDDLFVFSASLCRVEVLSAS